MTASSCPLPFRARCNDAGQGTAVEGGGSLPPAAKASWAAAQRAQQQKNYATAAREYLKVISLSPGFAEAYMNLGLVYELQSRRPDAIAMFEKAVQLKPDLAGAQFFLGVDYCKQGDTKSAIPHLEAAVRARPNLPDAWSWLASAYQMDGETSRQVNTLEAGLQANPREHRSAVLAWPSVPATWQGRGGPVTANGLGIERSGATAGGKLRGERSSSRRHVAP